MTEQKKKLSSIYPDDVLVFGCVLSIKCDGPNAKDPVCLLMEMPDGERFEAWLGHSSVSIQKARTLEVGDDIQMIGSRCHPIMSHRDYDGIRTDEDMRNSIGFFRVTNLSLVQREANFLQAPSPRD